MCANTLGKTPNGFSLWHAPKALGFQFADNPLAPERNASGVWGFFVCDGTITVTSKSVLAEHGENPGPLSRVVIVRLIGAFDAEVGDVGQRPFDVAV